MRRKISLLMVLCFMLALLAACGQQAPTWQEQYDLGVRYLEDGNYEEAIIAFTAAIEIDPKQAPAYVGRGDAYIGSGETAENLAAAQADYETAIELDETNAQAYLGLADVYIRRGEYDKALEVLKIALDKTGNNQIIADKIAEIESGNITDSSGNVRRMTTYDGDGNVTGYQDWFYDEKGNPAKTVHYDGQGINDEYVIFSCDEDGRFLSSEWYTSDGIPRGYTIYEYNEEGKQSRISGYSADGALTGYQEFEYGTDGKMTTMYVYDTDTSENSRLYLHSYNTYQYDENGWAIRENCFDGTSGELIAYSIFVWDDTGKNTEIIHYDAEGNITNRQVNN